MKKKIKLFLVLGLLALFPSIAIADEVIVTMDTPGTLRQLVQATGVAAYDMSKLTINGNVTELNQDDYDFIHDYELRLSSYLHEIDLSGTRISKLPDYFFSNMYSLEEIKLPSTLKVFPSEMCYYCPNLESVTLDYVEEVGSYAFSDTRIMSMTLPKLKKIDNHGFSNMSQLNSVTCSENLKVIGDYAFTSSNFLNEVKGVNNVDTIGNYAFYYCRNLKQTMDFGNPVYVGDNAFEYSGNRVHNIGLDRLTHIGTLCFVDNMSITSVDLSNVTYLGTHVFSGCTNLESVVLPANITEIPEYLFYECTNLKSISLPNTVTKLGYYSFYATGITEIEIPASVSYIDNAFSLEGVTSITCHSALPPKGNEPFVEIGSTDVSGIILKVPAFGQSTYAETDGWKEFTNVVPLDEAVSILNVGNAMTLNQPWAGLSNDANINVMCAVEYDDPAIYLNENFSSGQLNIGTLTLQSDPEKNLWTEFGQIYDGYATMKGKGGFVPQNVQVSMNGENMPNGWYYLSMPFDVKVSDITNSCGGKTIAYAYSAEKRAKLESGWKQLGETETIKSGKGFIIAVEDGKYTTKNDWGESSPINNTVTLKASNPTDNNIVNTRPTTIILEQAEADYVEHSGWNLVGNPFAAYYNISCLSTDAPITVLSTPIFMTSGKRGGSGYVAVSPIDDKEWQIRPYETFFIQATEELTSLTFSTDGISLTSTGAHPNGDGGIAEARPSAASRSAGVSVRKVYNLIISDGKYTDRARFVVNPAATADYDLGRDAAKMIAEDMPQIYTIGGTTSYAIDERPSFGETALGVIIPTDGEYTIKLKSNPDESRQLMLTDAVTNQTIDITDGEAYTFTASAGTYTNRFSVKLCSAVTGIENVESLNGDDNTLYDLSGRRIVNAKRGVVINKRGEKRILNVK